MKNQKNKIGNHKTISEYWIIIGCMAVVVIVTLIIQKFFFTNTIEMEKQLPPMPQTYKDAENYYTITLPPDWTASENSGISTTGIHTNHPVTQNIEIAQMYRSDRTGIVIQIYEGTPDCKTILTANTFFAGLPAFYEKKRHLWIIPTTDAKYVISYFYPGLREPGGPLMKTLPTPVPQQVMDANQALIENVLQTMKLTHHKPLTC